MTANILAPKGAGTAMYVNFKMYYSQARFTEMV